jgi:hypothetical protein
LKRSKYGNHLSLPTDAELNYRVNFRLPTGHSCGAWGQVDTEVFRTKGYASREVEKWERSVGRNLGRAVPGPRVHPDALRPCGKVTDPYTMS